jgi:hypothetical protein
MKLSLSLVALILVASCAKKKPYEKVFKEEEMSKSEIASLCTDADPCLYAPSVGETPKDISASRPFWQGEVKLVSFEITKDKLKVKQIETDSRFTDNQTNKSPVLSIDITHKEYRCRENEFGECSNQEEEVTDENWKKKNRIKFLLDSFQVEETNSLPIELSNLFGKCFSETETRVVDFRVDKKAMNFKVQKTYKAGIECADVERFEDLKNLSFTVEYFYSIVKLKEIASNNYEKINYPHQDETTFGFFTTKVRKLAPDNTTTLDTETTLMNRWNPKNSKVTYYLNSEFYKKGQESILLATEKAFATINRSLAKSNAGFQIEVKKGDDRDLGDIRKSFIVLVKDPQASGVIGYGPSITNPLTGEILSARVVMYYGTIRKFIKSTYDEIVEEMRAKSKMAQTPSLPVQDHKVPMDSEMEENRELARALIAKKELARQQIESHIQTHGHSHLTHISNQKIQKEIFDHSRVYHPNMNEDLMERLSRENVYHASMIDFHGAVEIGLIEHKMKKESLKNWDDLSLSEQEVVINKLMPVVWVPTLVHEIGHNLGLRHNFNGSEDKANYYTKKERLALGIERDVTYSSVMDYSYSNLNQLNVMGKYDIAALRFGYARHVETKDGKLLKVENSLSDVKEELKEFKFCTDEHVAVNPNCNRFDDGASLTEIAEHWAKSYEKDYKKRAFRNRRENFSSLNDDAHLSRIQLAFSTLRVNFEVMERIVKKFNIPLEHEIWTQNEFLKDLKGAVDVAFNFYMKVLETPSLHCVILNTQRGALAGIVPIENISQEAISCFDSENIELKPEYAVIGETGKHFNHAQSPYLRDDLKADPTQIDVRGLWIDKVLATHYLTQRESSISTFNNFNYSFLDFEPYRTKIMNTMESFLKDESAQKFKIKVATENGEEEIELENVFNTMDNHIIKKSYNSTINRMMSITKTNTDFIEVITPMLKNRMINPDETIANIELKDSLDVIEVKPETWVDEQLKIVDFKNENGAIVARFALNERNKMAHDLLTTKNLIEKLSVFKPEEIIEVLKLRQANQVPTEIEERKKILFEADFDQVLKFVRGEMMDTAKIYKSLKVLAK